jgi:hypothetical protein
LGKDSDWGAVGPVGTVLVEHRGERGLELGHRRGTFFACDGRGRLGFARSLPRTTAYTPEYDKCT